MKKKEKSESVVDTRGRKMFIFSLIFSLICGGMAMICDKDLKSQVWGDELGHFNNKKH